MAPEIHEGGDDRLLIICDHASSHVPEDIDLGLESDDLDAMHIAVDVGARDVARLVAQAFDAPAILATVSRLVIDLHREPDHPKLVPTESDGHAIPGNVGVDKAARIRRFYDPYHGAIADQVAAHRPDLIVSIHSFTPQLATSDEVRPWTVGILYNRDDRAARFAIDWLRGQGIETGDNEPYSGKLLNATLNRHAEAHGIPYLAVEIVNDAISDPGGIHHWATKMEQMIVQVRNSLASTGSPAT
ncbi:N-formylglutamate amidohydrolase [Stakelama tenebrarum]|uniref:N-formylglutamate amidohydrolase n=1 Tax=Stakelama tenebrarum TaxID=2711215 RepID=A0A6G6Y612_9SPHN|nr:N-formylglutamate amidohydrolase [Sphingosinithalassobacter tenebrarum]QIG80339.1 N-formylglutamate amidohydrolase [Sphingosinithalassobacter tenebrarum]